MFHPITGMPRDTRRGIILLIVLAMLTLFAIIGVSFVMYAGSMATSARNAREAESPLQPNMEPELLFSWFLSQLIFDADDVNGVYSAMRGHSLARTMFGQDSHFIPPPPGSPPGTLPTWQAKPTNTVPYNGIGRVRYNVGHVGDEREHPNYTYFQPIPSSPDPRNNLRDPERYYDPDPNKPPGFKPRPSPNAPYNWEDPTTPSKTYVPSNASYTYPDLNNMFLGAVKAGPIVNPATGTVLAPPGAVLMQSFHRSWNVGGSLLAWAADTSNPRARARTLRPHPADHLGFPPPEDEGGDVKNLLGSPGFFYMDTSTNPPTPKLANNDSIWMDLGAPVMVAPDGTKYKALFAPFITDLDNRINLNVHGNMRGSLPPPNASAPNTTHASNQGWGPWEVNLQKVLDQPDTDPAALGGVEWPNLFRRFPNNLKPNSPTLIGKYGGNIAPDRNGHPVTQAYGGNVATPGNAPHFYAPPDFDGCDEANGRVPTASIRSNFPVPQPSTNGWLFYSFPEVPSGFNHLDNTAERTHHPMLFNYFNPQKLKDPVTGQVQAYDSVFPISNMEALLRYGETNSPGLTSDLYRMAGKNFDPATSGPLAATRRNLVTTHGSAVDRAGVTPWAWNPNSEQASPYTTHMKPYVLLPNALYPKGSDPNNPASAGPIPFPDLAWRQDPAPMHPLSSEFAQTDWRAISAAIQRVDLNRRLTPYPTLQANQPYNYTAVKAQFDRAEEERRTLATDVYLALVSATGAYNPMQHIPATTPPKEQLLALRWLAQLAVNVVDYIDADDIMTSLLWPAVEKPGSNFSTIVQGDVDNFPIAWVFGTELPRVVLNEAYAEYQYRDGSGANKTQYNVHVWAELYNSFRDLDDPNADPNRGTAWLQWQGQQVGNYRLIISKPDTVNLTTPHYLRRPENTVGTPYLVKTGEDWIRRRLGGIQECVVNNFAVPPASAVTHSILPSNGRFKGNKDAGSNPGGNDGFYVIGPKVNFPTGDPSATDPFFPKPTYGHDNMTYEIDVTTDDKDPNLLDGPTPLKGNGFILVLQRLACPYLPFNPPPGIQVGTDPNFDSNLPVNPYVTIDYIDPFNNPVINKPLSKGLGPNNATHDERRSFGRRQPYAADQLHLRYQEKLPTGASPRQVHNSFFRHNSGEPATPFTGDNQTLETPFDWLYHLDRQLVSPMELLNVSAFKPHELLQQFYSLQGRYQHLAPWFDQTTRLYRVFEFLHTHNRGAGMAVGGRLPGQVNLNTVWDAEILQALCDPHPVDPVNFPTRSNYFTPDEVNQTFQRMLLLRGTPNSPSPYVLGNDDRPFRSMATGYSMGDAQGQYGLGIDSQHPSRGIGINDTFLRAAYTRNGVPAADKLGPEGGWGAEKLPRLFQTSRQGGTFSFDLPIDNQHPYFQNQMLTKIFNNLTTRSNVFGVWVTVGFFKVQDTDPATGQPIRPVKLGAEVGRTEGRHIRHRMFAIVDRTNLTMDSLNASKLGEPPLFLSATNYVPDPANPPANTEFAISGAEYSDAGTPGNPQDDILRGYYEGLSWEIKAGRRLRCGYGNSHKGNLEFPLMKLDLQVAGVLPPDIPNGIPPRITFGDTSRLHSSPFMITIWPIDPVTGVEKEPSIPGNPGPQTRFNPRDYPWIVRHFSIIE